MADNKKYYYMRLKDDFFEQPEIVRLQILPDGHKYVDILLKMYLRSLKDDGRLRLNSRPYDAQLIAYDTRHSIDVVEKALVLFVESGLIEILDNGTIYMLDIPNYIGKSSSVADKQREYRNRINTEKESCEITAIEDTLQMSQQMMSATYNKCCDKSVPEIRDKRLEIRDNILDNNVISCSPTNNEQEQKKREKPIQHKYGTYDNVRLSDIDIEKLQQEFPLDWHERIERLSEYMASTGKSYKNHLATIRSWAKKEGTKKQPLLATNQITKTYVMTEDEKRKDTEAQHFLENYLNGRG